MEIPLKRDNMNIDFEIDNSEETACDSCQEIIEIGQVRVTNIWPYSGDMVDICESCISKMYKSIQEFKSAKQEETDNTTINQV